MNPVRDTSETVSNGAKIPNEANQLRVFFNTPDSRKLYGPDAAKKTGIEYYSIGR